MTIATAFEGVLWDMDGVLVDSERLVRAIFVEVMADGGPVPDAEQRYLETIGLNRAGLIDWFGQFVPDAATAEYWIDQTRDRLIERAQTDLEAKPGAAAALDHLRAQGIPQLVVTSTSTDLAEQKLGRLGLLERFDGVLGGDKVSRGKPDPEPYLAGSQRLGLAPARALAVEDSPNGVRSALAAGCAVLHVPDLIDTHPDWADRLQGVLPSLVEFPAWFDAQTPVRP